MNERKYFGTDGIRGRVGQGAITPDFVLKLGYAAGKVLSKQGTKNVLIGKDTRISNYMLESALEAGLAAAGLKANLMGPMPTPAVAYLTQTFRAEAGIVLSASHNPSHDNGIKFFSADGTKLADDLELEIEKELEKPIVCVENSQLGKAVRIKDAAGRYIEFCKSTISHSVSLQGLKIVVDCANGATYEVAPKVFKELGAEVIAIGVEPNGVNINAGCGATDTKLLEKTVIEQQADIGIALDGDGDRLIMVDHKGEVLDGDQLLFIIVRNALLKGSLKGGVVGTLMTNLGVELAFGKLGIPFVRANVGDRYVMEKLLENDWQFGGEGSGHIICLNKTSTGDGIVAALQVLAATKYSKQTLHDLAKGVDKFPQVLINVRFTEGTDPLSANNVKQVVKEVEAKLGKTGRVLLRKSGTEPLLRVMVEGQDQLLVQNAAEQIAEQIKIAS